MSYHTRQIRPAAMNFPGLEMLADIAAQQSRVRIRVPEKMPEANISAIECGYIDGRGVRQYTKYIYGREMDVFFANDDPERRLLVKAGDVAATLNITTSHMAMLIARRRHWSGIYQAGDFMFKRPGRHGLRKSGYYITLDNVKKLSDFVTHVQNKS